jgi:phosphatidylglycerophosphate synthase
VANAAVKERATSTDVPTTIDKPVRMSFMITFLSSLEREALLIFSIPLLIGVVLFALSRLSACLAHISGSTHNKLMHVDFLKRWRNRMRTEAITTFFAGELPKTDNVIGRIFVFLVIGFVVVFLVWVVLQELVSH